jgi:hypothetical protein
MTYETTTDPVTARHQAIVDVADAIYTTVYAALARQPKDRRSSSIITAGFVMALDRVSWELDPEIAVDVRLRKPFQFSDVQ